MTTSAAAELSRTDYELIRRLIHERAGIQLGPSKLPLMRARLAQQLRADGFGSYRAFYEHVRADASGAALAGLIDALSTNTTRLFREPAHFEFLAEAARAWRAPRDAVRVWSAACSTGDEAYSIAMTLDDALRGRIAFKVLATDISTRALDAAAAGVFDVARLAAVPAALRRRYFTAAADDPTIWRAVPELRARITFARLNLIDERFPFRNPFDVVFCRNVMIYFDRSTQERLIARLATHLRPGGYLLVGHAESLSAIRQPLRYVRPAVYQRPI